MSLFPNLFGKKITGTVVLMPKNVLDINSLLSAEGIIDGVVDGVTSIFDSLSSILNRSVSIRLISADKASDSSGKGKIGDRSYLEGAINNLPTLGAQQQAYSIYFDYDSNFGVPGAFYIDNYMDNEFFLVSLTLDDIPNQGTIHFVCNSWVYNSKTYPTPRIFFANNSYVPSKTPGALVYYREEELKSLRGSGTGVRQSWERVYDYDTYNDLGDPDKGLSYARPVLGGSSTYPYPRRGRTGRSPTKTDPKSESRSSSVYIPRDEAFGHLKSSDFLTYGIKSVSQDVIPALQSVFDINFTPNEFDSFDDVRNLYEGGIQLPTDLFSKISPLPMLKEIFRTDGEQFLKFPPPKVIQVSKSAWMTDEEFGREIVAGVNPGLIRSLQEFPPKSKLDSSVYGDHTSTITKEQLELNLDGLTVDQALQNKKLFLLDHHDVIIPYLRRINSTSTKAYASRTILFLKNDGTLKPLAIELSLPSPQGDQYGVVSNVYLPATEGVESTIWLLAKAYVIVNDSCYHQLVSHWLNTHAVVEPFVIATNRQLSVLHPINKLLHPHYRDTMNINALARESLVNADGIIEKSFLWGSYAMEMSSKVYKDYWVFPDQALPNDLIKRGIAEEDPSSPHGLRLLIEDYPYAVDGLDIWSAIKTWVQEYVSIYYPSDDIIQQDSELQSWWNEIVNVGHGDKKGESWWPKMQTRQELIESCSTIIWIASALHAAVNFGQYPYGGFILNRPTLSRRFMPEQGTPEYDELSTNPQKAYLRTITPKFQTLIDLSVIEILSRHTSDEYYLGQRDSEYWTSNTMAIEAFKRFGKTLAGIEQELVQRNNDETLRNRVGPVSMPYTLLYPSSEEGLTFRGIPNSISI